MKSEPSARMDRLPTALINRLTKPFVYFFGIEAAAGLVLLVFTIAALILANSPWGHSFAELWEMPLGFHLASFEFDRSIKEWINNALMTLFFFLVSLELKRELVLGELNSPRVAALSIAGALGGMLVPAGLYLAIESGPGAAGWGTVMATDTAFVVGCLALLGSRLPQSLRVFMLSLAIVDDIGAILVVAIGYSSGISWLPLGSASIGAVIVRLMAMAGIRSFPFYFLAGCLIWLAVEASGIHATVTGVILGLMTPARRWVSDERLYAILDGVIAHPANEATSTATKDRRTLQLAEIAARETLSPVERLEIGLHPWVAFVIMPLFALANAGFPLALNQIGNSTTVAILAGFAVGKPIGVLVFSWVAVRLGIAIRPADLSWSLVAGGSFLAGIGFTMALFIAELAFDSEMIDRAKLGILLGSLISAIVGLAILRISGRTARIPSDKAVTT